MRRTPLLTLVAIAIIIVVIVVIVNDRGTAPPSTSLPPFGGQQASVTAPGALPSASAASEPVPGTGAIGERTKSAGCTVNGALPDAACTPGAIIASATKEQICVPGYSKNVRNVPQQEKNQAYAEYGIRSHAAGSYEVDHLISLELGGSNEIANLWPEAAEPRPGFHEKDRYENYAHDQVCRGQITLQEAQQRISGDWLKYWQEAGQP